MREVFDADDPLMVRVSLELSLLISGEAPVNRRLLVTVELLRSAKSLTTELLLSLAGNET